VAPHVFDPAHQRDRVLVRIDPGNPDAVITDHGFLDEHQLYAVLAQVDLGDWLRVADGRLGWCHHVARLQRFDRHHHELLHS